MPSPTSDAAACTLRDTLSLLAEALDTGLVRAIGRVTAVVTGVPVPTLNGVWVHGEGATPVEIEAGLELVRAHEVTYCIQSRPGCRDVAAEIAQRHAMLTAPEIPLMTTVGPASVPEPRELAVRRLEPTESRLHAELAASAFAAPAELFETVITESTLALPQVRGYVGTVGDEPVATAIAVTVREAVGVFNVATAPEHRRRGYGTAVTARAVADGRAAGATWSWLQASDVGYGIYARLGFRTLEHWACWIVA